MWSKPPSLSPSTRLRNKLEGQKFTSIALSFHVCTIIGAYGAYGFFDWQYGVYGSTQKIIAQLNGVSPFSSVTLKNLRSGPCRVEK